VVVDSRPGGPARTIISYSGGRNPVTTDGAGGAAAWLTDLEYRNLWSYIDKMCVCECVGECVYCSSGWMGIVCMYVWMDIWRWECMYGWMDGCTDVCVYVSK